MKTLSLVVALAFLSMAAPAWSAEAPEKALAGIDQLINDALTEQKIPGAAVAVVVGDDVVLLEGYGLRDIENDLPIPQATFLADRYLDHEDAGSRVRASGGWSWRNALERESVW